MWVLLWANDSVTSGLPWLHLVRNRFWTCSEMLIQNSCGPMWRPRPNLKIVPVEAVSLCEATASGLWVGYIGVQRIFNIFSCSYSSFPFSMITFILVQNLLNWKEARWAVISGGRIHLTASCGPASFVLVSSNIESTAAHTLPPRRLIVGSCDSLPTNLHEDFKCKDIGRTWENGDCSMMQKGCYFEKPTSNYSIPQERNRPIGDLHANPLILAFYNSSQEPDP